MATLEDKILGEKLHNYCSSSEESDQNSDSEESEKPKAPKETQSGPPLEINKWEGTSSNTGPKGVIEDWKKFKKQEKEAKDAEALAKIQLAKKLTLSVRSTLDEELEKAAQDDPELADLLKEEDQYLVEYQKKRMTEMLEQKNKFKFAQFYYLKTGKEFLDAIDKEDKSVTIIIHIFDEAMEACRNLNACLTKLCKVYESVKFCAIQSAVAGVSRHFKSDGIPALLVYKSGNLIGNFVRVSDDLGADFQTEDVQNFLVEHGLIEDKSLVPTLIRGANSSESSDSD